MKTCPDLVSATVTSPIGPIIFDVCPSGLMSMKVRFYKNPKKLIIHFKVTNKIHHKDRFNEINSFYASYAEEMGILFHTYTGFIFLKTYI